MIEMEYDTKKAPLGKITTDQIRAGYKVRTRSFPSYVTIVFRFHLGFEKSVRLH